MNDSKSKSKRNLFAGLNAYRDAMVDIKSYGYTTREEQRAVARSYYDLFGVLPGHDLYWMFDAYEGEHNSIEDYVCDLIADGVLYADANIPIYYIDTAAIARDFRASGEYYHDNETNIVWRTV